MEYGGEGGQTMQMDMQSRGTLDMHSMDMGGRKDMEASPRQRRIERERKRGKRRLAAMTIANATLKALPLAVLRPFFPPLLPQWSP